MEPRGRGRGGLTPQNIILELKREIDGLRAENSELKFHLYLHFPHVVLKPGHTPLPLAPNCTREASTQTEPNDVVAKLEVELTGAGRLIDQLQWLKVHQERRIVVLELKVEEQEKQLEQQQSLGVEIFQLHIPSIMSGVGECSPSSTTPSTPSHTRRRSSSSSSRERRPSLHSILPDDYKESVSTLPPIKPQDLLKVKFSGVPLKTRFNHAHHHHLPGSITSHPLRPLKGLLNHK